MIKTILIATDFSLESLDILKKVLKKKESQNDDNQYNILFVSGYDMGDSIRELLFTTKNSMICKVRSQDFCDAYSIICNKYSKLINKVTCDIFTGNFQRTFNHYLEALNIDEAYYSSTKSKSLKKNQFELTTYLKKNKHIQPQEVVMEAVDYMPEKGRLAQVFS